MLELIDKKVWDIFKRKGISLAIVFDVDGNIIWYKGREIKGSSVYNGSGFSKTYIREALIRGKLFSCEQSHVITENGHETDSILILLIKSVFITQISDEYFLYTDSMTVEQFKTGDIETLRALGEVLGVVICRCRKKKGLSMEGVDNPDSIPITGSCLNNCASMMEPLLIIGETGTGKTYMAEMVHQMSGRKGKFVVVNAPNIPESLFESEVFGYKKGAFTNAVQDRKGLVEEAEGGTLLIDEITEVSVALQAKLLRFIETGMYARLGESKEKCADVRVIATTNKELQDAIEKKEFREDLYYRLSVLEIEIPPLRVRKKDLKPLVMEKIDFLNRKNIGTGFWQALYNHDWPGNVRELFSVLKRAGISESDVVDGSDIEGIIKGSFRNRSNMRPKDEVCRIWNDIKKGKSFWEAVKTPFMSRELKRSEVKAVIDRGVAESRGNYRDLIKIFNVQNKDYHRLMRFLYDQELIPSKKNYEMG